MIYARADGEPLEVFARRVKWLQQPLIVGDAKPDALREAWGTWLGGYPWDSWGTLTFKHTNPTHEQLARAWGRFSVQLRQWAEIDAAWFMGSEVGSGGRAHLHCLIGGLTDVPRSSLWSWWFKRYGRCEVRGYDPERGAAHYVSKYVTKSLAHYDIELGAFHRCSMTTRKPESPSWQRMRRRPASQSEPPSGTPCLPTSPNSSPAFRLPGL